MGGRVHKGSGGGAGGDGCEVGVGEDVGGVQEGSAAAVADEVLRIQRLRAAAPAPRPPALLRMPPRPPVACHRQLWWQGHGIPPPPPTADVGGQAERRTESLAPES